MSVRQHLLATLAACLAVTLLATLALHFGQRRETQGLAENMTRERSDQLAYFANELSAGLALFVTDYSGWDEMVNFSQTRDPEWARLNLVEVMPRFRVSALWIVGSDGTILYQIISDSAPPNLAPPPLQPIIQTLPWSREVGGFYRSGDHIIDLRARAIQPTADTDRISQPGAWMLAARILDSDTTAELGRKLQAEVSLIPPDATKPSAPERGVTVRQALQPLEGTAAAGEWNATFHIAALELGEDYNRDEMLVLLCSGLLLFCIVAWSLNRNVLRPLEHIGESLRSSTPTALDHISKRLPEFARIADLVRESFWQREALRREIEDRVRLGRDLHDGVIQNLYATGMGLAHIQRLIHSSPDQAFARLEETRRTLNLTMDTLRGYITRSESEASADVELADACITLFQTLRADRSCELDLDISAECDAVVPGPQKANLLLIIREAVSNSLRHGQAGRIGISLRVEGRFGRLRVYDDGQGCDFSRIPAGGYGLKNISARARDLGGESRHVNRPGGGVEISVDWPLATPPAAASQPTPI